MDDSRPAPRVPPPRSPEGPTPRGDGWQTAAGCLVAPVYALVATFAFGLGMDLLFTLVPAVRRLRATTGGERFVMFAIWFGVPAVVFGWLVRRSLRDGRPRQARCVAVAAAVYGTLTLLATAGVRLGFL